MMMMMMMMMISDTCYSLGLQLAAAFKGRERSQMV
jgi:hypothetical protein